MTGTQILEYLSTLVALTWNATTPLEVKAGPTRSCLTTVTTHTYIPPVLLALILLTLFKPTSYLLPYLLPYLEKAKQGKLPFSTYTD